jgi:hypothetical protein
MKENGIHHENWQTNLNYSPSIKFLFQVGVLYAMSFDVLRPFERGTTGQTLPEFAQGKLADVGLGAFSAVITGGIIHGGREGNLKTKIAGGFACPSVLEIMQYFHQYPGVYNPSDFAAYGIGALSWGAIEISAKHLHDSGITLPIYRVLHIKHQKFDK